MSYHERAFIDGTAQLGYMFFCNRCATHLFVVVADLGERMDVLGDKAGRALRAAGWVKTVTGWECPVHHTEGHDEASVD